MTSEGGGAVAFPVLTLALSVDPSVARDVALMVQGCGMTCASFAIIFMHVTVEVYALIFASLGGLVGLLFGLFVVDPALSAIGKKMAFVSIWFSFASVLIFLNRYHKRPTFNKIQNFNWWKGLVLVLGGFVGGVFTSFAGTGLDITTFSILTLLFRISEKVATPTTVILMASNSLVAWYYRTVVFRLMTQEAWEYITVTAPIVTIMAPVGSLLGTHFHRIVLAAFVIILDIAGLVAGYAILRPLTPALVGTSVAFIVGFFGVFMGMTYAGQKMLEKHAKKQEEKKKADLEKANATYYECSEDGEEERSSTSDDNNSTNREETEIPEVKISTKL